MNPERKRMMAYLSSFGLNGEHILTDSIAEDGYNRIDFPDEDYYRLPWPEGFSYRWLCSLQHVAHLEDMRLAGVRNATRMVQ